MEEGDIRGFFEMSIGNLRMKLGYTVYSRHRNIRYKTMESRSDELYHALCEKGYPDEFCKEIAYQQMNTDYTATQMLGYPLPRLNPRPEDVVDEMLAILTDREAIIQKKELEHAQATINKVYRKGL